MAHFLLLHGPNLNLLGSREPDLYGSVSLSEININLSEKAKEAGHIIRCFQSNAEHELIEQIQNVSGEVVDFVLINPAAFTHTSIALRDALLAVAVPFIEVHLSNVHSRESFRHTSYFSDIAIGVITGFGPKGYELAFEAGVDFLEKKKPSSSTISRI